ncbi:hypothetical protein M426DRAFT_265892 [Hypoxylon sp. CI-4A]|nr:hypothetical protein M426DRAFT_265892 [Hypoxylon sp. CI-4A]
MEDLLSQGGSLAAGSWCCSSPACDLPTCPDDALQPSDPSPATTTSEDSQTSSSPTSMSLLTTPTAATTSQTTESQLSSSPSSSLLSTPSATHTPESSSEGHHQLSTAAIAGISVGATILGIIIIVLAFLLIRRRYIARGAASVPYRNPFSSNGEPKLIDAERFMTGRPPSYQNPNGLTPVSPYSRLRLILSCADM